MRKDDAKPTVGIIVDKRGDPPYTSVDKLWNETVNIVSQKYDTEILEVESYKIENDAKYRRFISKIDVLILLSPYYTIDRSLKEFPVIVYGLGSMQKGGHWLIENQTSFKRYDYIILNCTACQAIFDDLVKENSIQRVLIPFGVDTSVFYPITDKIAIRRKYNVPENAFIMVYCGRINLQKNPFLLLSLLRILKDQYEDLRLMFIGSYDDFYISEFSDGKSPDVKTEFQKMINDFGLSSKIIFFENQNDPYLYSEMINMADIGINLTTLLSENFGYAAVEMQACGLPVIGAGWGGLKDTIIDGVTGFHINTVQSSYGARINLEQAKDRIHLLIKNNKKLKVMGKAARENVEKNYSSKVFAANIQNIIQETYDKFIKRNESKKHLILNPLIEKMSAQLHKKYGNTRHISWEHLHPKIDFNHYDMIASKCATCNY
ncbi:MAG: glycosyltransferase [Ruminococcus flavefaciens]|nr:glycosyltransferase [Ruminococcus flavefaciens]